MSINAVSSQSVTRGRSFGGLSLDISANRVKKVALAAIALYAVSNVPCADAGFALLALCLSSCAGATGGAFIPMCVALCTGTVVVPTP